MSKYTDRITNYNATKQKYFSHIALSTQPLIDVSSTLSGFIADFDIDTAVGVQLDSLGIWIGRSRIINSQTLNPDSGYTVLSDDTYRIILKAKIAINNWNGQNGTLPEILDAATAGSGLKMQILDNQDMTISVLIFPETDMSDISSELLAAISAGYLTVKAAGVLCNGIEIPSEGSRFFGFDIENEYIAGFEEAAWGVNI